jgi:hypothetical protein
MIDKKPIKTYSRTGTYIFKYIYVKIFESANYNKRKIFAKARNIILINNLNEFEVREKYKIEGYLTPRKVAEKLYELEEQIQAANI